MESETLAIVTALQLVFVKVTLIGALTVPTC